jgi:aminoglycoside phosphotransferase (APT) family kinase protein
MEQVSGRGDEERKLRDWLETVLGAEVCSILREDRWRPSWIAKVLKGKEELSLYIRGDRGQGYSFPLAYEADVMRLLERNGIPVPHVFGMCDDPEAIIMTNVTGERQLSGLTDPAERRRVIDEYIGTIAAMHAIDISQFEQAGFANPVDPGESQQNFHRISVNFYRNLKARPEPFVEWVLAWMDRNVPRHRTERSFVTYDAGQFLVDKGRVSAIYDFEMAHINDPLVDLAGWRVRNAFEPLDDITYMYSKYESLTGRTIDCEVINYHVMALSLAANLAIAGQLATPTAESGIWLVWEVAGARYTLSAMADILNVKLENMATLAPVYSSRSTAAAAMKAAIEALPFDNKVAYQRKMALILAEHLRLVDLYGETINSKNLAEVEEILGWRPSSINEADMELEKFVKTAGAEYDERLLQLFHRRIERLRILLPSFEGEEPLAPGDVGPFIDRCHLPSLKRTWERHNSAKVEHGA